MLQPDPNELTIIPGIGKMFESNINLNEDGISNVDTSVFQMTDQQEILFKALNKQGVKYGNMYQGALFVLYGHQSHQNPDRLSQAANSLRELMEKMARELPQKGNPNFGPGDFKSYINSKLNEPWNKVKEEYSSNWAGEIKSSLHSFLVEIESFFGWVHTFRPPREKEAERFINHLDSRKTVSGNLVEIDLELWKQIRKFFEDVTHHRNPDINESRFIENLSSLESFLLNYLHPRTFENFATLDQIIQEGENRSND